MEEAYILPYHLFNASSCINSQWRSAKLDVHIDGVWISKLTRKMVICYERMMNVPFFSFTLFPLTPQRLILLRKTIVCMFRSAFLTCNSHLGLQPLIRFTTICWKDLFGKHIKLITFSPTAIWRQEHYRFSHLSLGVNQTKSMKSFKLMTLKKDDKRQLKRKSIDLTQK